MNALMFASEKSIPNFQLDNGCVNISKALNIITPWPGLAPKKQKFSSTYIQVMSENVSSLTVYAEVLTVTEK